MGLAILDASELIALSDLQGIAHGEFRPSEAVHWSHLCYMTVGTRLEQGGISFAHHHEACRYYRRI